MGFAGSAEASGFAAASEVSFEDERAAFAAPESPGPVPLAPALAGERIRPTVKIHPQE